MTIKWSIADIVLTVISFGSLLVSTILFFVNWISLPQTVAVHYNALGEADDYGDKGVWLILVAVAWVMVVGIFVLEFFPKAWNTGVTVTYSNHDRIYRVLKSMIVWINMLSALLFSMGIINVIYKFGFFGIVMGILVAGIFAVIIVCLVKLFRLRKV